MVKAVRKDDLRRLLLDFFERYRRFKLSPVNWWAGCSTGRAGLGELLRFMEAYLIQCNDCALVICGDTSLSNFMRSKRRSTAEKTILAKFGSKQMAALYSGW
jgi:hypothetical protein